MDKLLSVIAFDDLDVWVHNPKYNFRRAVSTTSAKITESHNISIPIFKVIVEANRREQTATQAHARANTATTEHKSHFDSKYGHVRHARKHKQPHQLVTKGIPMDDPKKLKKVPIKLPTPEDKNTPYDLSSYSIHKQIIKLTEDMTEANISTEVIGRTAEYNDIVLLKVTESRSDLTKYFRTDDDKYADDEAEKKLIFIVHGLSVMGMHGCAPLITNTELRKLLSYYFKHLDKFDLFLIPVANPDGYAHEVNYPSGQTYWNKNMSPQTDCGGVVLDRNFDIHFNSLASSSCSPKYAGEAPFTEPESRAVRDIMHKYSHRIVAYFHVHPGTHNYDIFKGDAVLYPRGYSEQTTDDDRYIDLRGELDEAMRNASFKHTTLTVENLHSWYGLVTGTSVDYASTVYGIPFALELVFQLYQPHVTSIALEEIWGRAIDVIFKSIHKYIRNNEVRK